jgi:hypothetical protein
MNKDGHHCRTLTNEKLAINNNLHSILWNFASASVPHIQISVILCFYTPAPRQIPTSCLPT